MSRDIEVIKLTNLDYAVAAYKYYKTSAENISKLDLEDVNNDITEIRDRIFNYGGSFIYEKREKGDFYYMDEEDFSMYECTKFCHNPYSISIGDDDYDSRYLYNDENVDNFIGAKIIEWIGEPEELRDTLEQATLKKSGDFYISDLIDFYKKENISLDELPKEIEEKFINGEYDKFKNEENKSNYEELKSLIESKEIASSFNASSSNSKKMRM